MNCIKCGNINLTCLDSRKSTNLVKRVKKCNNCKERFTTVEFNSESLSKIISNEIKKSALKVSEDLLLKFGFYLKSSKSKRKSFIKNKAYKR